MTFRRIARERETTPPAERCRAMIYKPDGWRTEREQCSRRAKQVGLCRQHAKKAREARSRGRAIPLVEP